MAATDRADNRFFALEGTILDLLFCTEPDRMARFDETFFLETPPLAFFADAATDFLLSFLRFEEVFCEAIDTPNISLQFCRSQSSYVGYSG
ncbi:MAG: hypothetical protein ACP5O1_07170 [Phycisphaerae bacterium]